MMEQLIGEARAADIAYLELSASENGVPLYEKLGFAASIFRPMELVLQ